MKIGNYVRYKNGEIEQIHSFAEKDNPLFNILVNARYHNANEIKKYGKLIDLIEEGDLVNNHIVGRVLYEYATIDKVKYLDLEGVNILVLNEDIKSIVTKEQFESMEYKVGE